eukprot:CAMPEP_0168341208 /NCGR_PEP_ID=MMETSP0213-20121227/14533_1 /TAXON_ID=151035 /ORGANISM="Euplotes harpa, Strain FSP1.4" /LENGTH=314 /DNA_ID=CAMNT_0008347613 /DNA_START=64 /DNA_END=1008 /DNA_ORIENTATION=-
MYKTGDISVETEFAKFLTTYNKNYVSEQEYNFRLSIFADQLRIINEHNAKGLSWTLGVNEFSDWTREEYKQMLGYKSQTRNSATASVLKDMPTNCKNLPLKSVNWKDAGFVTRVKNQSRCGSCWAFSAVGALEGAYAKEFGKLVEFSEQQLVECDKYSHGCNGGLMENGFYHWMRTAPRTEAEYAYELPPKKCHESDYSSTYQELELGYRVDITWECLYEALTHGVVSVAIRAENDDFRSYKSGVIDGEGCGTDLDHGVTLVGYEKETDAWIIKNSWGATWGESGFVRIKRAEGLGVCGINQQNSQPVFDSSHF